MDLIKIINRLENKGFNFSHDFIENNEIILQALIDETELAINYTRCSTQLELVYTSDFCRWLETGFTYYDKTSDFLCQKGYRYSFRELVSRYNRSHNQEALIV